MKESFTPSLIALLLHEGGFVNHPADPGGMTNLGVTKKVWEAWVKQPVSEAVMRHLQPEEVKPLYQENYWSRIKGDNLPAGVDYCVFDAAVNSGVARAVRLLQTCVGTEPDGSIGPATLRAVADKLPQDLIRAYCDQRLDFLKRLLTWDTFGKGWERRVKEVEQTALSMCK
jgi:lysozyme family protein